MVVIDDGAVCGSFSGGCIDDAVVAEALDVARTGQSRTVRFGSGSPYIDLRLPCGGAIDLLFTPLPPVAEIDQVLRQLDARRPGFLSLGAWTQSYLPPLRVTAFGQGEDIAALVRTARAIGIMVQGYAPRTDRNRDPAISELALRTLLPEIVGDRWTAVVFAFHDRDWEEFLLPHALTIKAFYYGAVGSLRTHSARVAALRERGVRSDQIDKLRGTIGLIPGTRDPGTLALSILAEVVQEYQLVASLADQHSVVHDF